MAAQGDKDKKATWITMVIHTVSTMQLEKGLRNIFIWYQLMPAWSLSKTNLLSWWFGYTESTLFSDLRTQECYCKCLLGYILRTKELQRQLELFSGNSIVSSSIISSTESIWFYFIYIYIHVHKYTYTYTYIFIYTYTYIYISIK